MPIASARDFVYLKYKKNIYFNNGNNDIKNSSNEENKIYCDIGFSHNCSQI
jgi:hypothetical protein